jgi:hypothetical protein
MALKDLLEKVVHEYPRVSKDSFKGHPFAGYFRNTIPKSIGSFLVLPDIYGIKASAGNGAWVKVPWIAIMNYPAASGRGISIKKEQAAHLGGA